MDDQFLAGIAAAASLTGGAIMWLAAKIAPGFFKLDGPAPPPRLTESQIVSAVLKVVEPRISTLKGDLKAVGDQHRAQNKEDHDQIRREVMDAAKLTVDALQEMRRVGDKLGGVGEKLAALLAVAGRDHRD